MKHTGYLSQVILGVAALSMRVPLGESRLGLVSTNMSTLMIIVRYTLEEPKFILVLACAVSYAERLSE